MHIFILFILNDTHTSLFLDVMQYLGNYYYCFLPSERRLVGGWGGVDPINDFIMTIVITFPDSYVIVE